MNIMDMLIKDGEICWWCVLGLGPIIAIMVQMYRNISARLRNRPTKRMSEFLLVLTILWPLGAVVLSCLIILEAMGLVYSGSVYVLHKINKVIIWCMNSNSRYSEAEVLAANLPRAWSDPETIRDNHALLSNSFDEREEDSEFLLEELERSKRAVSFLNKNNPKQIEGRIY